MNIDFEKVAEAIEKSSPEIKKLMFSVELGEKIQDMTEENNLDEETASKLADEIGYVILNLKTKSSFFDSLTHIGIDKNIATSISKEIDLRIFSELDKIKKTEERESSNSVGESFEQIILNQVKAMQPARTSGDGPAQPARESGQQSASSSQVPENLPTEQEKPSDFAEATPDKKAIHNYIGESDPYREPIE